MKKLLLVLLLGMSINGFAQKGSWTGYIGDEKCGTKAKDASHEECAKKCVKGGAAPVLVVDGKKVYKIDDPKKVADFIGKKVTITGKLDGETIIIEKVSA